MQIGYFVPAECAKMTLYDRICTRIGSDDDFESNASSFLVEMRETCYMITDLSVKSLLVIDELGRGTSTLEGLSLTTAVCEVLIRSRVCTESGGFVLMIARRLWFL